MVNNQSQKTGRTLTLQFLSCVPIRLFDWNSVIFLNVSCVTNILYKQFNIKSNFQSFF